MTHLLNRRKNKMEKQLIFLHLRSTSSHNKKKPEVIQISAIKATKDFKVISVFDRPVKPNYAEVDDFTLAKTTLLKNEIEDARTFDFVYNDFCEWMGPLANNAIIVWGKENIKLLDSQLNKVRYRGTNRIKSFFNFKSYLETKLGKALSMTEAFEIFNTEKMGDSRNSLDIVKNAFTLYEKSIHESDVSDLWFSGKLLRVKKQMLELDEILSTKKHSTVSGEVREKIKNMIGRSSVLSDLSKSFTEREREIKLFELSDELKEIEQVTEKIVMSAFRNDALTIQWSIVKGELHKMYKSPYELENHWSLIELTYEYFIKTRRGQYNLNFKTFKELFRTILIGKEKLLKQLE